MGWAEIGRVTYDGLMRVKKDGRVVAEIRAAQLAKARHMLEKITEEYERFPYRF